MFIINSKSNSSHNTDYNKDINENKKPSNSASLRQDKRVSDAIEIFALEQLQ